MVTQNGFSPNYSQICDIEGFQFYTSYMHDFMPRNNLLSILCAVLLRNKIKLASQLGLLEQQFFFNFLEDPWNFVLEYTVYAVTSLFWQNCAINDTVFSRIKKLTIKQLAMRVAMQMSHRIQLQQAYYIVIIVVSILANNSQYIPSFQVDKNITQKLRAVCSKRFQLKQGLKWLRIVHLEISHKTDMY